ncbi:MAG TPA: amino acid transporter, partial [Verrucomicrobiae bacterium]|nr:amino acid transporter [Verrucomicrobiae bacterium]
RRAGEYVTPQMAPWNLGRWAPFINVIAILWTVFIVVIFSIPPNELVLWSMLALAMALFTYWHVSAKRYFKGPHAEAK